jgi:hypothetical protein
MCIEAWSARITHVPTKEAATVPLASTAVGVVEPARAGMASGINSTLRQVGIATGVAALGSILASTVADSVTASLSHGPLSAHAHAIGQAAADGRIGRVIASLPTRSRGLAAHASLHGFATGLNTVLLIGALAAFAGARSSPSCSCASRTSSPGSRSPRARHRGRPARSPADTGVPPAAWIVAAIVLRRRLDAVGVFVLSSILVATVRPCLRERAAPDTVAPDVAPTLTARECLPRAAQAAASLCLCQCVVPMSKRSNIGVCSRDHQPGEAL